MDEYLLCIFGLGIKQHLAECGLIILAVFIMSIFTMVYFGQRTRIITPFANYQNSYRLRAGCITNILEQSSPIIGDKYKQKDEHNGLIIRLYNDEEGQGLVEYAMILFFAVIIVVSILTSLGLTLNTKYEYINSQMP